MTRDLSAAAERCLLPGFVGTEAPEWILRRAPRLGGVCLYARNVVSPAQVRRLCDTLHEANPALVIAIDEEGGDVTRLEARTGSSYPGNLALGAAGDVELTRAVARAIGLELASAGIDLDLAPDADVNSNPSNPVIGVRSFGSDPAAVAGHTAAWVRGLQSAGVAACVKHFPGHGDTSVDSHVALPVAGADPRDGALQPFDAAIAAGAQSVMSAHVVYRSMDRLPGTVSRAIMTGLLRDEMGFRGLAVSDGIEMRAIADIAGGTVQALAAGCDLICIGGGLAEEDIVERLHSAIVGAVADHRLSEARLFEAGARIDRLAQWRAAHPAPAEAPDRQVGLAAARKALRVEGDVRVADDAVVIQLNPAFTMASGLIPWGLTEPLQERGARVTRHDLNGTTEMSSLLDGAKGSSVVLTVRNLHRHEWEQAVAAAVLAARPDAVVVEMGLPACRPAAATNYIATHGAARVCATAAAEVMRP